MYRQDTQLPTLAITAIDHIVLRVRDVERSVAFYANVLGMSVLHQPGRVSLLFGDARINLHPDDSDITPRAMDPRVGGGDFCLICQGGMKDLQAAVLERLEALNNEAGEELGSVELGPVARMGALGEMQSLYLRDPDGNLVELACYEEGRDSA